MEGLLKRYFWIVNLGLLGFVAYLGARVINNVVAGEIAALETEPAKPSEVQVNLEPMKGPAGDRASAIIERNLFNSAPPEAMEDESDDGGVEDSLPDGVIPGPTDECKKSDARIGLVATMVAEPSEWSMAIIDDRNANSSRLVKELEVVDERKVAAIQRDRLVLAKGGAFECVLLGERPAAGPKGGAYPPGGEPTGGADLKEGIKQVGENRYELDRAMIDEQLSDLNTISRQARVIPHYRDGKNKGFKLVGVRPGSLYSHIGVRSGDVIQSVNGEEITSPNKALELFDRLKNENNVTVDIERRGRPVTLEYSIK